MSFPTLPNLTMPSFPNLPNGQNVSDVATDLLDAADKRVPTLSLNARRKFFHVLAVVMFLPGILFDVSYSLSPRRASADLILSLRSPIFHSGQHLRYSLLLNTYGTLLCTHSAPRSTSS